MTWAIQTFGLSKQFPVPSDWRQFVKPRKLAPPAVNEVTIKVGEGELFGLLGPNGAGKTTLIKMLCTLIIPTSGSARIFDNELTQEDEIRSQIGLVTSDERSFFWRLSGHQNLEFFASLHGLSGEQADDRINATLAQVDLQDIADKQFHTYSTGMRQRLAIARALLNEPRLLFLDEPSRGLDPSATIRLHEMIRCLASDKGMTIFLTTHNLGEAEYLCDRIAILNNGRIRISGEKRELLSSLKMGEEIIIRTKTINLLAKNRLKETIPGIEFQAKNGGASDENSLTLLESENNDQTLTQAIDILREENVSIMEISRRSTSLQRIFTQLVAEEDENNNLISAERDDNIDKTITKSQTERRQFHFSIPNRSDYRVTLAFLKKDWRTETSYRFSFILQVIGIFFSVTMFYFISQLFGGAADPYLTRYGTDYFSFVLIGIAFSSYFGVGLSSFSNRIRQAQTTGTLEAMLTTPTKHTTIVLSASLWDYLITTFRVIIYLAIGVIFMGVTFRNANFGSALLVLILSIISFSSIGIIAASFIMVIKRGDPVTWIVSSLSSLLGGVYYPVSVLPEGLRWIAMLIPITYSLDAMRLALLQGETIKELLPQIFALVVFCVVLLPSSILAFRYAVKQAKVDGSLTQY